MIDEMGLVETLRLIVTEFDDEVATVAGDGSGERSDLWTDVDVPIAVVRASLAAIERLVAENRALLNDNPLVSYDGARFVGADNEVLVAATPDVIRCPRPANGRPDSESVETCNASDNCGCCYHDRARQALKDAP